MAKDDVTVPQDGVSDHREPGRPAPFSDAMDRVRVVAQRILDRVKKVTEDTDVDATPLPPSDAPAVEQPPLPPPRA